MKYFNPSFINPIEPISLDRLGTALDTIDKGNKAALDDKFKIATYFNSLDINPAEASYIQGLNDDINSTIQNNLIGDNYHYAADAIKNEMSKLLTNPVLKGKLQNQKEWKEFNANLDARKDISDRDKDYYKEMNPYKSTIKIDSNGNPIGTETWTPNVTTLATPEYDKIFLEALQIAKPDMIGGSGLTFYDDNGNATKSIANASIMSYYSKTTGKKTVLSKDKIWSAIKGVIDTHPDMKEMIERDYDITDWYNAKNGRTTNTETRDGNGDPIDINHFVSAKYDPLVKAAAYIHSENNVDFHELSNARRNATGNGTGANPYGMYNGQYVQTEEGLVPLYNSAGQYPIDPNTGRPMLFDPNAAFASSGGKVGSATGTRGGKTMTAPGQAFGPKDWYRLNAQIKANSESPIGAETIAANQNNNSRSDMQTAADNLKQIYKEVKGRNLYIPSNTRIKFTPQQLKDLTPDQLYNLKAAAAKYNSAYDAYQDYKQMLPEKDRGTIDFIDRMNSTGKFNINASSADKKYHDFLVKDIFRGGNSIRISIPSNDLKENFRSKIGGKTLKNLGVKVIDDDTIEIDRSHISNVMPILTALYKADSEISSLFGGGNLGQAINHKIRTALTLGIMDDSFTIHAYDKKGNDLGLVASTGSWRSSSGTTKIRATLDGYNNLINYGREKIESQVGIPSVATVSDYFNGEASYYSLNLRDLAAETKNPALYNEYLTVHDATQKAVAQKLNNGSFDVINNRMSVDDGPGFREITDAETRQAYKNLITQVGVKEGSISVSTTAIKDNKGNPVSHTFQIVVPKDDKWGEDAGKVLTIRLHGLDVDQTMGNMFFDSNYANASYNANIIGRKAGISKIINETNLNRNLPYAKIISGGEGAPWQLKVTTKNGNRVANISKTEAIGLMGDMDSYNDLKYKILQQGIKMTPEDANNLMMLYPTIGKLLNLDYTNPKHRSIIESVITNDIMNQDIQDVWH